MNKKEITEIINTVFRALGILSVFFAGYFLQTEHYLSLFLFVCGTLVLCVQITFVEEEKTE